MKKKLVNTLLNKDLPGEIIFHNQTKIGKFSPQKKNEKYPDFWTTIFYKGYSRFKEILLPKPKLPATSLKDALTKRASVRNFSAKKLSLQKLSSLLYFSAGLKNMNDPSSSTRPYPSGGARYPLEIYLLLLNSELPRGLYHYYLKSNSLEELLLFDKFDYSKYFAHAWIEKAACILLISGVFKRTTIKYGIRGYRLILFEAGHLGQNIYLNAASFRLGCCAIGGFSDDNLNELIDLDGIEETIIYTFALGNIAA